MYAKPILSRATGPAALELWGGVECTVNRVGDRYFDQIARTGHKLRLDDVDRFADLGLRALRVPVLWEHVQPERDAPLDWSWTDRMLQRLQERGVRPIVGLLHHGFGPRWTDVRDPSFAEELAWYARKVAERYPWVDAYTPINEPLTTARFSALYGHWHPHQRDDAAFGRVLFTQLAAIARSMREIRRVNCSARLIQTEDLGKVASTPALDDQRDFENERRWLTWDVLSGMLGPTHACWSYLRGLGLGERELMAFAEAPCAPDTIGINHYITSERFLDERVERYPLDVIGGNGREIYADIAQVHVPNVEREGVAGLLRETWARYQRPIAITECHMGCTREEQMRWLQEVWQAALRARREGADVRAVTGWALLGSHDWNTLVTRETGHYESGAFDTSAPAPRRTAVARMMRALAQRGRHEHPVLAAPGWWNRNAFPESSLATSAAPRPILIVGGNDTPLGHALKAACESRGLAHRVLEIVHSPGDERAILDAMRAHRPWAVVNALAYNGVDRAESDRTGCLREHVELARATAAECALLGAQLVSFSSDLVFAGEKHEPYVESDVVAPLSVYGESRARAELAVLAELPGALLVRHGVLFGSREPLDFVANALTALSIGEPVLAPNDLVATPAYAPDVANASLDLLIDEERGVWHLSNGTAVSWYDMISDVAQRLHLQTDTLSAGTGARMFLSRRPGNAALASERGSMMPTLASALDRYIAACREQMPDWQALPLAREPVATAS